MLKAEDIVHFFENRDCCIKAATPLKGEARVGLTVNGPSHQFHFVFQKIENGNKLFHVKEVKDVDFSFLVPSSVVHKIIFFPTDDIGELGVFVLKRMMSQVADEEKIIPQMHISFFGAAKKGYLGVLALGGKSLLSFMAQNGISLSTLKSALQRYRA